ncbi:dihydrofolate reductase family protein [Nocardioides pyridinolyticus]
MRTTYFTATTLDGFIADDQDSLAWLFKQDIRDEGPLSYATFIADVGAMAMGATTYQWLVDHLAETGETWMYDIPAWVFTHRDLEPIGEGITFTADPVPAVHAAMAEAAGGKDLWVVGGGDLAGQFADHGLLDEIIASIAPVTLGAGRPLFPRRYDLELVEHLRNGAFICARYAVSGPL